MDMQEADRRALRQMFGPASKESDQAASSEQMPTFTVAFTRTLLLQVDYEASSLDEVEAWAEEQMATLGGANYSDATVRYSLLPMNAAARVSLKARARELAALYTTTTNLNDSENEVPFQGCRSC